MDSQVIFSTSKKFYTDKFFYAALLPASIGGLLPCVSAPPLWHVLVIAFAEEAVFRGGMQAWLEEWGRNTNRQQRISRGFSHVVAGIHFGKRICGPVSIANGLTSVFFALAHLLSHEPEWALGTFIPSLVFGVLYTRYKQIMPCAIAHATYNMVYFR